MFSLPLTALVLDKKKRFDYIMTYSEKECQRELSRAPINLRPISALAP